MKRLFSAGCVVFFSITGWASCDHNQDQLGASYVITQGHMYEGKLAVSHTQYLNLWRNNGEVAQEFPQTEITEIWNHLRDGRIRPVRYFDQYQRAIEYQPEDLNHGQGDKNWDVKYQLVGPQTIKQMTLVKQTGKDCEREEHYTSSQHGLALELVWLPELSLLKSYRQTRGEQVTEWQLHSIEYAAEKITAVFAKRASYQLTDYADIGDNHTDPFLLKMVKLGFLEEGASGFYDAEGNALEGHHH